jgi:hypothetical protein
MRLGLLIVGAGGALDLLYHALPMQAAAIADTYVGQGAWSMHLVALVGMALTIIGIFAGRNRLKTSQIQRTTTERSHTIKR